MPREERETRQFQLERLEQEGKPIYQAKAENEQVLFEMAEENDEKFIIYENNYQTAREVLDAITVICLPIWLEQLRELGVNDSLTWKFVQQERQERQNG